MSVNFRADEYINKEMLEDKKSDPTKHKLPQNSSPRFEHKIALLNKVLKSFHSPPQNNMIPSMTAKPHFWY